MDFSLVAHAHEKKAGRFGPQAELPGRAVRWRRASGDKVNPLMEVIVRQFNCTGSHTLRFRAGIRLSAPRADSIFVIRSSKALWV
jgi:hypothetical protein